MSTINFQSTTEYRAFQELTPDDTDPRDSSPKHFRNLISRFIETYDIDQALKLVYSTRNSKIMNSFQVDAILLMLYNPSLAYTIIHYSNLMLQRED